MRELVEEGSLNKNKLLHVITRTDRRAIESKKKLVGG